MFCLNAPKDAKVLIPGQTGALIELQRCGTVKVVPCHLNKKLVEPGHEWRIPINDSDEPDLERELNFLVG